MIKSKKIINTAGLLSSLLCASLAHSGSMGDANVNQKKLLLIEAGASYLHAFYKNSVTGANSYTTTTPHGVSYNPSSIFANDFAGGYIEASGFINSWLLNARYEMFAEKGKLSNSGLTYEHKAPVKLAFTIDKTWDLNSSWVYGLGGGAVLSTQNEAEIFAYHPVAPTTQIGTSFPGRSRIDPLVEGLVMYQLTDSFRVRANVAYQIPEHSFYTDGHIGVNLGINYAIPL